MTESNTLPGKPRNFFTEMTRGDSLAQIDLRGENAWAAAIKFIQLLEEKVEDPDDRNRLVLIWLKSVKDNDYKRFQKALKKWNRKRTGNDQVSKDPAGDVQR